MIKKYFWKNWLLLIMMIPGFIMLYIKLGTVFTMGIAFQEYNPFLGFWKSEWVGLENFYRVLQDPYVWKITKNTILMALYTLIFSFPVPLLFALFLNEIRSRFFKGTLQTLSFIPYFISSAVIVSITYAMLSPSTGIINQFIKMFGGDPVFFMAKPEYFRPIYIILQIWQTFGYNAIIYTASITSISPELYESAEVDGAGRWRKMFHITLPIIKPSIIVMLIVALGNIFSVAVDKILLLYNPSVYETADVIQTYVYRIAFESTGFPDYGYATAVNMIMSVVAFVLVTATKKIANKYSDSRIM